MSLRRTPAERAVEAAADARDLTLDKTQRGHRGVVHTPVEVARFTAREVDRALRKLGRRGLADPDVVVVDPACGPGVYLASALAVAGRDGPRLALGMDLDRSALDRARSALTGPASAAGWDLRLVERNTLDGPLPLSAQELRGATVVLIGNPPWAGRTANRAASYTDRLLADFRRMPDGSPLLERKIGVLSDDYVRFIRWASEIARRADGGAVLALATNASFLDGPVHRGMRGAMSRWFAEIDVVDLGGSALIARRGDRDENVFRVRPGAAITVATRPAGHREERAGRVRYAALRGARSEKLQRLRGTVEGEPLAIRAPSFRFKPGPAPDARYAAWRALPELMPFHREGLQTNRDALCVGREEQRLIDRLGRFARGETELGSRASRHYDPEAARAETRAALAEGRGLRPIAYRPFDRRWVAAVKKLCHRPRPELLRAMDRSEVALLTVRKDRGERPWMHFGVSAEVPDNCYCSTRSSCRTRAFPTHRPDGAPNLDHEALADWSGALSAAPTARALCRYALALFGARSYRERYDAHLRRDYPRLPSPPDDATFEACVAAGARLEACFLRPDDGWIHDRQGPVVLGHHRFSEDSPGAPRYAAALEVCEAAVAPLLSVR